MQSYLLGDETAKENQRCKPILKPVGIAYAHQDVKFAFDAHPAEFVVKDAKELKSNVSNQKN